MCKFCGAAAVVAKEGRAYGGPSAIVCLPTGVDPAPGEHDDA
jgi:hypothetical protein